MSMGVWLMVGSAVAFVFAVGFILGSLYEKDRVDDDRHWQYAAGFDDGWEEAHRMMPTPCSKPSPLPSVYDHTKEA